MSATRDRLLDAFEGLLIAHGPRAATLDAVAGAAEVSKGGLLYHFPSKAALVQGRRERLAELGRADVAAMRAAPEGAAEYYLRESQQSGGQVCTQRCFATGEAMAALEQRLTGSVQIERALAVGQVSLNRNVRPARVDARPPPRKLPDLVAHRVFNS